MDTPSLGRGANVTVVTLGRNLAIKHVGGEQATLPPTDDQLLRIAIDHLNSEVSSATQAPPETL